MVIHVEVLQESVFSMSRPARRAETIWNRYEELPPRPVDLAVLGEAITGLPPMHWQERMFFLGARDRHLKSLTGKFPATFRKDRVTHLGTESGISFGPRRCFGPATNWS